MAARDEGESKLLWVLGTAAATALVVYQVNKYMREKESLTEIRAMERIRAQLPQGALEG